MFHAKFGENRSRHLNFKRISIFVYRDINIFKCIHEAFSKKELCETGEEAI